MQILTREMAVVTGFNALIRVGQTSRANLNQPPMTNEYVPRAYELS